MWKETFRIDGEYWEKSSLTKRQNEDEENFENNRGYRKNKLRYFEDVLGLRIATHEVLKVDDGLGTKTEETVDFRSSSV